MDAHQKRILTWISLGVAGAVLYEMFKPSDNNPETPGPITSFQNDPVSAVSDAIKSLVGWKSVNSADQWLPALAAAEVTHNIPTDLLARMAYQESHFREEIIRGTKVSPAGALGILQLMPQYFDSVRVAIPFSDDAVMAQIDQAAVALVSNYNQFNSWPLALAAYNAGAGNVKKYGGIPPFAETQNYVAQITGDVPGLV